MSTDLPDPDQPLTEAAAEAYVARTCFKTGPPGQIGVELEWLLHDVTNPAAPVHTTRLCGVLSPDLARGALSTEPGGQLELSSRPHPSLAGCLAETAADLTALRAAAGDCGVRLTGLGVDPLRPPARQVFTPRYDAMERFFARTGPHGEVMMCSTAAVQVCVEAATPDDTAPARWSALHALGPVLVAAFANSPLREGRPTGWRSTRQAVWARLDPGRSAHPDVDVPDPAEAWARYTLAAEVLAVMAPDGHWEAPPGLTLRGWLRGDGPRPATRADVDYHLSTLFPPVRPRGCLELRVIDAQPGDGWTAVATAVAALLDDPKARDAALAVAEPVRGRWEQAARDGLADSALAAAASGCFAAALDGAERLGLPAPARAALAEFTEHYVDRARCPADDVLDAWVIGGAAAVLAVPDATELGEESVSCRPS
ncbi:MAG TPA: ergothioneine biosynthesis glutamate--cysteine ligase EgtA [Mycobacteriales bacterium]|nr:ergothioneine biosynthesis glutamate--cysteine ligase EgtA [Mycobacteriales bacterium]